MHPFARIKFGGRRVSDYDRVAKVMTAIQHHRKSQFARFAGQRGYRLNVGCGEKVASGFINLDYTWHPRLELCWDVTKGLPFESNTASVVFSEHCLEHITREQCRRVLQEFLRILLPDGLLRVVVPDAEIYVQSYLDFRVNGDVVLPYATSSSRASGYTPLMALNRIFRDHGHQYCYDFHDLHSLLKDVGFRNVVRCSYRTGKRADALVDSFDREPESLYVEAEK